MGLYLHHHLCWARFFQRLFRLLAIWKSPPKTIGLDIATVIMLDALRKQRNLSDYEGDPIAPGAVAECLKQAETLLKFALDWLAKNKPELQ